MPAHEDGLPYYPQTRDVKPYFVGNSEKIHLPAWWTVETTYTATGKTHSLQYFVANTTLCGLTHWYGHNIIYLLDGDKVCQRCLRSFQRLFADD